MHSTWALLLLPQLELQNVYDLFNFKVPIIDPATASNRRSDSIGICLDNEPPSRGDWLCFRPSAGRPGFIDCANLNKLSDDCEHVLLSAKPALRRDCGDRTLTVHIHRR
jgi:hypothetical protein